MIGRHKRLVVIFLADSTELDTWIEGNNNKKNQNQLSDKALVNWSHFLIETKTERAIWYAKFIRSRCEYFRLLLLGISLEFVLFLFFSFLLRKKDSSHLLFHPTDVLLTEKLTISVRMKSSLISTVHYRRHKSKCVDNFTLVDTLCNMFTWFNSSMTGPLFIMLHTSASQQSLITFVHFSFEAVCGVISI